jgi:hypothetical protein
MLDLLLLCMLRMLEHTKLCIFTSVYCTSTSKVVSLLLLSTADIQAAHGSNDLQQCLCLGLWPA